MLLKTATIAAASALLFGPSASAAAVPQKRIPVIGAFAVSPFRDCPITNGTITQLTYGNDCGKCNNFWAGSTMKSIDVKGQVADGKCVITVYNTADCSDPGIQSGPSCWAPEGGVKGWTITCPWADPEQTYQPPCAAKPTATP
ncbi:hypothetical protein B0H63DRAFT_316966 [Podospora didyma]|uniref:Uncharacterized protein n=1 Tax=Podospora didyma TaxID=330526 RepID=A0AAE0K6G5_9PEZI|nr:hypothetical protein B0H63DRAFT_316966 [Podospora didyma]